MTDERLRAELKEMFSEELSTEVKLWFFTSRDKARCGYCEAAAALKPTQLHKHHAATPIFDDMGIQTTEGYRFLNSERFAEENPSALLPTLVKKGEVIADLGCGPGYYSLPLAEYASTLYCVDSDKGHLAILRERLKHSHKTNIHILNEDAAATSIKTGSVDVAFFANSFHDLPDKKAAALEAARILRERGRVVIIDWSKSAPAHMGPPTQLRMSENEYLSEFHSMKPVLRMPVGKYHFCIVLKQRE